MRGDRGNQQVVVVPTRGVQQESQERCYQGVPKQLVLPVLGSLYQAMGIRSGDVVKRVNKHTLDAPSKALLFFEALETLLKEPFSPHADNFPSCIQFGCNLIIV